MKQSFEFRTDYEHSKGYKAQLIEWRNKKFYVVAWEDENTEEGFDCNVWSVEEVEECLKENIWIIE